jgi:Mg2+-importing ATPase
MSQEQMVFWSISPAELLQHLQSTLRGLTSEEARLRLIRYGANLLKPQKRTDTLSLLLAQFISPIVLILLCAAVLSFFLHDTTDALIILAIVLVSGLLGFWQERGAADAVEKLLAIVQVKATVLRDECPQETPVEEIVPGDVVAVDGDARAQWHSHGAGCPHGNRDRIWQGVRAAKAPATRDRI